MSKLFDVMSLRPTQFCLGFIEIDEKISKIEKMKKEELQKYLDEKKVPVVVGPNNVHYMIDRHHLVRCCWELGIEKVVVNEIADLSHLSTEAFWEVMKTAKWCYLYDQFGNGPHSENLLPESIRTMSDDGFRSLAYFLRDDKVYNKNSNKVPFIEFYWANYLRKKIKFESGRDGMRRMMKTAKDLIKKDIDAQKLPGYKSE